MPGLWGGPGADRVLGNGGHDVIDAGEGLDVVHGNAGDDRIGGPDATVGDIFDGDAHIVGDTCAGNRGDIIRDCEFEG